MRHLVFALDVGAHGHQEVAALDLHAVAREVEKAGAAGLQPVAEGGTASCNCFWLAFSLRSTVKPAFSSTLATACASLVASSKGEVA